MCAFCALSICSCFIIGCSGNEQKLTNSSKNVNPVLSNSDSLALAEAVQDSIKIWNPSQSTTSGQNDNQSSGLENFEQLIKLLKCKNKVDSDLGNYHEITLKNVSNKSIMGIGFRAKPLYNNSSFGTEIRKVKVKIAAHTVKTIRVDEIDCSYVVWEVYTNDGETYSDLSSLGIK